MRMSRRSGFSMLELMTTLIILGIMAAMAVPRLDFSRMRSDAALRQLTSLFVQAQRTALSKQYNVIVSVDAANSRLRFIEDKNNSNTFDTGDRDYWMALEPGVVFVDAPVPLEGFSGRVSFARIRMLDGFPSVIFRRNGAASSDASMFVTAKPSDAGAIRGLTITQSTGRAEPFKYNGIRWVPAGA
jgi:prepilin-type N-terminal cleavage/methylation domain-containing protein